MDRGTQLREVRSEVAALVALVGDLDDLVLRFGGTEAGRQFLEASRRARIIVDRQGAGSIPAAAPAPRGHDDPASSAHHPAMVIA